ncbi:hypothetical protein AA0472_2803 [Acetobacter estunensis NRIC 0472]|uniref:Glycosyltransferase n=1 Tax=Acetobacter estunensis TaxID=104097 RepID=A0A967EIM8_9PROT|nr:glycosyltransferase [Acetobacter estunensis]GBQ28813.1 hypothetical protein AA0472_2803 [Acetobacter estunensis NRIC 0472]
MILLCLEDPKSGFLEPSICVKSLGLARNHGIRAAAGRYIATADADDLVCVNYLHALHTRLAQTSEKAIVFPEYYHAFGCDSFVARLYELRDVGIYRLAGGHPYVSRIMARREELLALAYTDCANNPLYAFEDYDLNLRAVAAGFDLIVASNAVVFYRQRPDSIMRTLRGRKLAPNCDFFAPDTFLSLSKEQDRTPAKIATHYDFSHSYTNSSYINSLIYYANRIDPEVQPVWEHEKKFFTMLGMSEDFGRAYGEICRRFGGKRYTDVFLMPFLSMGGAEKYIVNFIRSAMKDPARSCLLVLGQYLEPEKARSPVPKGLDVIDLGALLPPELMSLTSEMTLRVIENLAPDARVFLKFCPYSEQLMTDHGAFLAPHEVVYFYFCSSFHVFEGRMYEDGAELQFMRENRSLIDHVISDHQRNLDELVDRVPSYRGHTTAL